MTTNAFVKRFLEGSEGLRFTTIMNKKSSENVTFVTITNKVKKLLKHYNIEPNIQDKKKLFWEINEEQTCWELKTIINKESERRASYHTEQEKKQYCQEVLDAIEYYYHVAYPNICRFRPIKNRNMDLDNHPGKKILLGDKKFYENNPEHYLESLFYSLKYHYYFIYLRDQINSIHVKSRELIKYAIEVLLGFKNECKMVDNYAYYIFHAFSNYMGCVWKYTEPSFYLNNKVFLDLASQYFQWNIMLGNFKDEDIKHPNLQKYLLDIEWNHSAIKNEWSYAIPFGQFLSISKEHLNDQFILDNLYLFCQHLRQSKYALPEIVEYLKTSDFLIFDDSAKEKICDNATKSKVYREYLLYSKVLTPNKFFKFTEKKEWQIICEYNPYLTPEVLFKNQYSVCLESLYKNKYVDKTYLTCLKNAKTNITNSFVRRFFKGSEGLPFLFNANTINKLFSYYDLKYNTQDEHQSMLKLQTIIIEESKRRASNHTEEEKKQYSQEVLDAIDFYVNVAYPHIPKFRLRRRNIDVANHPGRKILLGNKKLNEDIYPEYYLNSLYFSLKYHYYFHYLKDNFDSLDAESKLIFKRCYAS